MTCLSKIATLAALGSAVSCFAGTAARAADTEVTCYAPQIEVNTGQDGTQPRMTLHCTGGSSVTGIDYFAFEISVSPSLAQMIQQTYQGFLETHKKSPVLVSSNLSDTSGNGWGCGVGNCRIIDFAIGH